MRTQVQSRTGRSPALIPAALFVLAALWLTMPPAMAATAASTDAQATANAYVVRVDGLACPYCAYGIEKQFSNLQGVTGTTVNIAKGVVVVHVKPGTRFTAPQIKKTVNDAGFTLKRVVSTPQLAQ